MTTPTATAPATAPRWNWKARRDRDGFLAFEDGTVLRGVPVGAPVDQVGEVVFNTGMSGYQEIITDPSYAGQMVTMTYTEIGNTGVNPEDIESRGLFLNGLIVHDMPEPRNWRSTLSLSEYLRQAGVPALAGIDTRSLTVKLRTQGTLKACLGASGRLTPEQGIERARAWEGLDGQDYAARVSCTAPWPFDPEGQMATSFGLPGPLPPADLHIVCFDFGVKYNILRQLRRQGMRVTVVPAQTTAEAVLALRPDGVFLSNGPADPAAVTYAIEAIRDLLGRVPIMGICLGHQLIGCALGGRTYRLKFGHHGCNHPVMDLTTHRVEITSQNHNFAVDPDSLPAAAEITHVNLNDNTVEGLQHREMPLFCVQYHPEAAPGPHDASYLFKRFRTLIAKA
ncbi:MAG: glutamine-hydrolyzing carbamoyl-phosphate synthase small subunit [Lentisphaerae bacterium]|nr:glutamine-hydrolyzing carbamoyl-phosphate synthase small subunit [Lentisphaerota bacterium]